MQPRNWKGGPFQQDNSNDGPLLRSYACKGYPLSHCGFRGSTPYPRIGFIFQNFKAPRRLYEVMSVLGLAPWILVSGVSVSMFCTEKETRSSTERNYVQMGLDCSIGTSSSLAYKCEGANMYRRPKQTHWMSPCCTHAHAQQAPALGMGPQNGMANYRAEVSAMATCPAGTCCG